MAKSGWLRPAVRTRGTSPRSLADEAFRDLLQKHGAAYQPKTALRQSAEVEAAVEKPREEIQGTRQIVIWSIGEN